MTLFNKIVLSSLVCVLVYWCICLCTELRPSNASNAQLIRQQRATDFDPGGICGRPLFSPPSTFARVQSRFEFVELGGDMCYYYQGEVPPGTGITGWYQLVPHTIYVPVYIVCRGTRFTCIIRMNIWMRMHPFVTYAWRTWEHILLLIFVVVVFILLRTW